MLTHLETPDLQSSTDDYARRFAGKVGEWFIDLQSAIVQDLLPVAGNGSILDIGGGHGQLARPLVEAGFDVTVFASDASCKTRLDRIVGRNRYKLVEGNLLDLKFAANSFDFVLAFRLLPHLNDWRRLISEACRVANKAVILDYPDLRSVNWFSDRLFALKKGIEKNTRTYQCFRRNEIKREFQRLGYTIDSSHAQFLFPMALHRLLKTARLSKLVEGIARASGLTNLFGSPIILKATRNP